MLMRTAQPLIVFNASTTPWQFSALCSSSTMPAIRTPPSKSASARSKPPLPSHYFFELMFPLQKNCV